MSGNTWIYALVAIVIVVLINLALLAMLRGGRSHGEIKGFQRLFQDIRNPYRKENEMLDELSRRVAELKEGDQQPPDDPAS